MYLYVATYDCPQQGARTLHCVSPYRQLDLLTAIRDAVIEWCQHNNFPFYAQHPSDLALAVREVPDAVCAAHGFRLVRGRLSVHIGADQEPHYNDFLTV